MPDRDEPLPNPPDDEIEEISSEFIVGEASKVDLPAPARPAAQPAGRRKGGASPGASAGPAPAPRVEVPGRAAAPIAPREPPAPAPVAPRAPRSGFPILAALVFLVVGFGGGFFAGRLWERQGGLGAATPEARATAPVLPAAPSSGAAPEPPPAAPKRAAKPTKGTATTRSPRATGAATEGKGRLDLTAPPEAEVFLDGRRIGKGSMHVPIAPGVHRIEVRLGKNRVGERFEVAPNESWTYDVTPTR